MFIIDNTEQENLPKISMQISKQKGFIINKSRIISHHQLPKQLKLNQTVVRSSSRSPGFIKNVKFNHQMTKSFYSPQYQYQEINKAIALHDQQIPQLSLLNNPQNQSINISNKFSTSLYLNVFNLLKKISQSIKNRKTQFDTLNAVKSYLQFITANQKTSLQDFCQDQFHKKDIRDALLYERVSMIMITLAQIKDLFDITKRFLNNLITFSIKNFFIIGLMLTKDNPEIIQLANKNGQKNLINKQIITLKNNNQILFETINKISKIDDYFHQSMRKVLQKSKSFTAQAAFTNLLEFYAYYLWYIKKAQRLSFLAIAPNPYLTELDQNRYSLIIDFTQVFCNKGKKIINTFRPYSEYFIQQMSQYYQIITFCNAMPTQINPFIDLLDKKKIIKHRLYKYHMQIGNVGLFKDLSRLGRCLNRVVLIDSSTKNDNSINVPIWTGKKNDPELAQICPLLAMIAIKKVNVPFTIKRYQQKQSQYLKLGLKYSNYSIDIQP